MFGRNRFGDLIAASSTSSARRTPSCWSRSREYRERWRRASREGAEEAFGDEQDRVDWAAEALSALCDRYAATLDEETEAEYRRAFTKAVRRRLPASPTSSRRRPTPAGRPHQSLSIVPG